MLTAAALGNFMEGFIMSNNKAQGSLRRFTALGFAICGTLLILLLYITGRMIFMKVHVQSFEDIAGRAIQHELTLAENQTPLESVTGEEQIAAYRELLGAYTYTEYQHFFKPSEEKLTANRLTVGFENGNSIGVDADGNVFVNGKLMDIEDGRGQELYHKLYVIFYPNAA